MVLVTFRSKYRFLPLNFHSSMNSCWNKILICLFLFIRLNIPKSPNIVAVEKLVKYWPCSFSDLTKSDTTLTLVKWSCAFHKEHFRHRFRCNIVQLYSSYSVVIFYWVRQVFVVRRIKTWCELCCKCITFKLKPCHA